MIALIGRIISRMVSIFFSSIMVFGHVVILAVLGLMGVVTGLCTLLMPILGLLRAFGMENIFIIKDEIQGSSLVNLPVGMFLGIICAVLSWLSFRILMKYLRLISKEEHNAP
ncbi:hypothetical protein D1953_19955 [Peribacillus asahii]|uniref:Uncharacterized protein n=1 Tax=Peribacillus asahii TaxID=228899 RepID=A0A398AVM5_9BACI|nr:hypothetical protein [Peribacillus asahii]RID81717.1 hypothetical protein D1953_19955 [Peribacillus asahii]